MVDKSGSRKPMTWRLKQAMNGKSMIKRHAISCLKYFIYYYLCYLVLKYGYHQQHPKVSHGYLSHHIYLYIMSNQVAALLFLILFSAAMNEIILTNIRSIRENKFHGLWKNLLRIFSYLILISFFVFVTILHFKEDRIVLLFPWIILFVIIYTNLHAFFIGWDKKWLLTLKYFLLFSIFYSAYISAFSICGIPRSIVYATMILLGVLIYDNFCLNGLTIQKYPSSMELLEAKWKIREKSERYISGRARNPLSMSYLHIQVEFDLFDADGNQIGTASDEASHVGSHESWDFEAKVTDPRAVSFKLKGFTGY